MAEKIKFNPEADSSPENHHEQSERIAKHHETKAEASSHEHQDNLEQILDKIEKTAKTSQEAVRSEPKASEKPNPKFVGSQLKENNLKASLRRIRGGLKPYQRPFSRVIHNPAVESISEVSAKTIARPEGLLSGGLFFFVTSLTVLVVCRYFGYEYNYYIGLISFPVGFAIGVATKFILQPFKRK